MAPMVCFMWRRKGECPSGDQCTFDHPGAPPASKSTPVVLSPSKLKASKQYDSFAPASSPARFGALKERNLSKPDTTLSRDRDFLMKGSGKLVVTLEPPVPDEEYCKLVRIENTRLVASYNWLDRDVPTIMVPGHPAKLAFPEFPFRVPRDSGKVFVDQNKARSPTYPFDALFRSISAMDPSFDMSPIELVTDRSNLLKLMAFASGIGNSGRSSGSGGSWRMDVDVVENTMFLTRWSRSVVVNADAQKNPSCGQNMPTSMSSYPTGFEASTSHHRIIQYKLGGIECLVRFEVDGYVEEEAPEEADGEYSVQLEHLQLEDTQRFNGLQVIERGTTFPPNRVLEIKSRSEGQPVSQNEIAFQYYVAQVDHLYIGYNKSGYMTAEPQLLEMASFYETWEMEQQERLRGLVRLLGQIKEAVSTVRGKKGMVVFERDSEEKGLRVYERKGWDSAVPPGMEKMWQKV